MKTKNYIEGYLDDRRPNVIGGGSGGINNEVTIGCGSGDISNGFSGG